MTLPNRKFGVEIECNNCPIDTVVPALTAAGISVRYEGYTHNVMSRWKFVTDGSLHGPNSYELVSPPLFGEAGLDEVRKVCKVLVQMGVTVNSSCGLHVHVDANDLQAEDVKSLVFRYMKYEGDIDSFMPRSRRGNSNSYCRSITGVAEAMQRARETDNVRLLVENTVYQQRFYKLNVAAFLRHGTIEFRQHSGTVNATKVANWIQFCLHFVEASKVRRIPVVTVAAEVPTQAPGATQGLAEAPHRLLRPGERGYRKTVQDKIVLLQRLLANGNVDTEVMANEFGITPASVGSLLYQMQRQNGVGYSRQRNSWIYTMSAAQRPSVERALQDLTSQQSVAASVTVMTRPTPRPAPTATARIIYPHTNTEDSMYAGMPPEVVNYYTERTLEMAA